MPLKTSREAPRVGLTIPIIFLVLAATAIPIEWRAIGQAKVDFAFDDVWDIVANIVGYVPIGAVLMDFGFARALLISGLLSAFAETGQLAMMHRDPSLVDVLSNVAGAAVGFFVSSRFRFRINTIRVTPTIASIA